LTGNIVNETISIQKDNIMLNGGGYTLEGFGNGFAYDYEAIDLQNVTNVTVVNFNLDSFWQPIQAHNSLNLQIKANNLTNCASEAISFDSCNNSVIAGNNLEGTICITNIYGEGESTNNTIIGNTLYDAAEGIQISDSSNNVISDNKLTNIYDNIGIDGDSNIISNNTIINGIEGIFAGGASSIFGNTIDNMADIGLGVSGQNNKIYENTVESAKYGVFLQTSNESESTVFYHNNFINNTQNVELDQSAGPVKWDNGKEGNYWSSYNGTGNSDGIDSTPYNLGGNNVDLYPLTSPYVPQSAMEDYSMGQLLFTLAIIVAVAGILTSLFLRLKFKTHR
jgi:parallel beta-helix repeat protein